MHHRPGPHSIPRSPLDAAQAAPDLPSWDLADLYKGQDDPGLEADLTGAEAAASAFNATHNGRLEALSGDALAAAIAEYERVEEILGRAMSFASLIFAGNAQDSANGRFYQTMQERVTAICSHLVFFTLELNRLE